MPKPAPAESTHGVRRSDLVTALSVAPAPTNPEVVVSSEAKGMSATSFRPQDTYTAPGHTVQHGRRIHGRLLFVVNSDWFFLSHRLPLAKAARDAGAEVIVSALDTGRGPDIEREGFRFLPLPMSRKGINPIYELRTLRAWLRMYRELRPDLVHHVTIKPVLYGSLVARFVSGVAVVNAVTGLGYVFSSRVGARCLRMLATALYRLALGGRRSRTVFQNSEDRAFFVNSGLIREEQTVLIRGSGVDCSIFHPAPEPQGAPIVMLASRLLWDKGVAEFVEAARLVRAASPDVRFVLVGKPDAGNRTAIPDPQLEAWARDGIIEWWGHRDDMPAVLQAATIFVLPTWYREGLPKVLLEAAATGRAIVATDMPGCREIVRPGVNGILVPPKDGAAVARAIQTLLASPELRQRFGRAGRKIAVSEFSEEIVVEHTLEVYRAVLGERWPRSAMNGRNGNAPSGRTLLRRGH